LGINAALSRSSVSPEPYSFLLCKKEVLCPMGW
jgi:hypothetical protein